MTVPFAFTAEQIGPAFPESFKKEIVEIRKPRAATLREQIGCLFVPIAPETYLSRLTLLENALYGRVSALAGAKADLIEEVVAGLLTEKGMRRHVAEVNFDLPTGLGGARLPTIFHERAAFARAGIKRPDVLVLDRTLASHNAKQRQRTRGELRKLLPEATLNF